MHARRILVADDHTAMCERIAALLAFEFDVVATVADGQAAVEAATSLQPELVVLDISMPVLSGLEAAAIIKELPDAPQIVFLTAHENPAFAEAALSLGAARMVLKRHMMVELVPVIRQALMVHAVHFYEEAASFSRVVGDFIVDGLVAGEPAVVIAGSEHSTAIVQQLIETASDPHERMERGELVVLDANELLSRFMIGGMPCARRLHDAVNPIFERATRHGATAARIYGEMVDVLWASDKQDAAVSLEILWNQLAATYRFALLCGYARDRVGDGAGFQRICSHHSCMVSADTSRPRYERLCQR